MRRLAVVLALLVPVYALAQSTITVVSDEAVAGVTVTKTGVDSYTISLSGTAASILHASSHASAGTDPVTLSQSQITGLSTTLSGLVPYTGATGDVNLGSYGFAFDDGGADLLSIYDDIIEMQNTTTGTVTRIYSDYLTSPRLYSTIATGTAPFSVVSTTLNTNLNADMVDGYSIPVPSTSGNVLTSNGTAWTSAAPAVDGDAVTGNEVTNATDSTLTRSGSGTAVAPYTLGINLGTANTWTADQRATHVTQSKRYDADDPRPYGWPVTAANASDDEFEDGTFSGWTWRTTGTPGAAPETVDESTFPGFARISRNVNGLTYYWCYKASTIGSSADFDMAACGNVAGGNGDTIGVMFADSSGNGIGLGQVGDGGYHHVRKMTFSAWGTPTTVDAAQFEPIPYWRMRRTSGTLYFLWSSDGIVWQSYNLTSQADTTNIAYVGLIVRVGAATHNLAEQGAVIDWFRQASP